MNRLKCFLTILAVLCFSACSDDKTQRLQNQVGELTSQVGQLNQLVDSLTNQVAHLGGDLRAQVDTLSQEVSAARNNILASPGSEREAKDSSRFQLVYAPFPLELDQQKKIINHGEVYGYDRLFLIDGKTGKVWRYSPFSTVIFGEGKPPIIGDQGFVALPTVEAVRELARPSQ
jgi:outer membrane murein-binding lipoprotein Lpp